MIDVTYEIRGSSHKFHMPAPPDGGIAADRPAYVAFDTAREALSAYSLAREKLLNDTDLSPTGLENRLAPMRSRIWETVTFCFGELAKFEQALDAREAVLVSLPKLDPSASAVAIEDREVRDWWRAQSGETRSRILDELAADGAAQKKYERLQIALLRSPVPVPDHDLIVVRDLWTQLKRLDNAGEAFAIDSGRAAAEWARRGLAHMQGIAQSLTGWSPQQLADFLAADANKAKVAGAMGFNPQEIAMARRRYEVTLLREQREVAQQREIAQQRAGNAS